MLAHEQGRKAQACLYVFMVQAGILFEDILFGVAGRKKIRNGMCGDSFAADGPWMVEYGYSMATVDPVFASFIWAA